ncbi:MAG: hypothetical protein Q9195_002103 [Heterodermia aff. obscurata]
MDATNRRQRARTGPAWQTLFNNTYPHFGNRRNRATNRGQQQPGLPPQGGQNLEAPQVQNVEPPAPNVEPPVQNAEPPVQNVEPPEQNVEPPAEHVEPEIAARAPSPEPAAGQNPPEVVQQPIPQVRRRRQNIPRAEQRPPQNDDMPRRGPRDNHRPEPNVEPLFVVRPNNRAGPNVEPLFVRRPNNQGHGEARHRRENPGPRNQRWARDIENSRGRGNARSDARIIVESDTVSNASSSGSEAPPVRPFAVDLDMANAYWETSSTTSAIDDSRESRTGSTDDGSTEDRLQEAENNARRNEGPLLESPDRGSPENLRPADRRRDGDERHTQEPLIGHRHRTHVQEPLIGYRHRTHVQEPLIGHRHRMHVQEPLIVHRHRNQNRTPVRNDPTQGLRGILRNGSSHRRPGNER